MRNETSKAKTIEWEKPRWPSISSYWIPKPNPMTSASGKIVRRIDYVKSERLLGISFVNWLTTKAGIGWVMIVANIFSLLINWLTLIIST